MCSPIFTGVKELNQRSANTFATSSLLALQKGATFTEAKLAPDIHCHPSFLEIPRLSEGELKGRLKAAVN